MRSRLKGEIVFNNITNKNDWSHFKVLDYPRVRVYGGSFRIPSEMSCTDKTFYEILEKYIKSLGSYD